MYNRSGFAEVPSNETINLRSMELVVFRCSHMSSEAIIVWLVNGSLGLYCPDITTGSISENGTPVYTLIIPARSEYNGTEVVCVAVFTDGSPTETTPPATLIITGLIMMTQTQ